MTKKLNTEIIIGLLLIVTCWLFIGIFSDPEFDDKYIFTKYRPTFKVAFDSPIGESDLELTDLSKEKQAEEIAFEEFVVNQSQLDSSHPDVQYFPFLLIQLTITYLMLGLFKRRNSNSYRYWQIILHILINIFTTTFGIALVLTFYALYMSGAILIIVVLINYFSIYLLVKRKKKVEARNEI